MLVWLVKNQTFLSYSVLLFKGAGSRNVSKFKQSECIKIQTVGIACSRLSDSGEGPKEWGRRESVGCAKMGAGREKVKRKPPPSPQFPPVFLRVRAFSIPRARLSRSLEQANSENWKQTERSMKLTAQNMERMYNKHSKYKRRHGWTHLKIETNCNRGFKKLVSLTVFESSF